MNQRLGDLDNVVFRDEHPCMGDGRRELLAGLRQKPKVSNPKWLYDQRGSELFDQITRLPEYYPTRTEFAILREHASAMAEYCGSNCLLIEPGSGSSAKARVLLNSLTPALYVPIDISAEFLRDAAKQLGREYPWLPIHAICADFNHDWHFLDTLQAGKRVVFYPGSTLGNLEPEQARDFLCTLREVIGSDGGILIGVDTHKDTERLNAAYNDSAGVTAAFNQNLLLRMNSLLDAEFDPQRFAHRAFYNESERRIEMHLLSEQPQIVRCGEEWLDFRAGESIHTENSYKYSPEDFSTLAHSAGLEVVQTWMDAEQLFSVHYLQRATD
jgi:dimethylhistidine N-methyltransferase